MRMANWFFGRLLMTGRKSISNNGKKFYMKTKLLWTLPLVATLVGCQEKASSPVESVTARETNAPVVTTKATTPVDADNTGLNVRDRTNATLTPLDQGTSPTDLETSQKIRKALVNGPTDYSVAAKNIKVITVNGKVTLRGPVQSAAEKTAVASLARSVAGDANVDDQLEVKANP